MHVAIHTTTKAMLDLAPKSIVDEIIQNVRNIFNQRKNQIPFQRDMGVDTQIIDERIEVAMMLYQTDMARQVKTYEPRAKVYKYDWSDSDPINGNLAVNVEIIIDERYI